MYDGICFNTIFCRFKLVHDVHEFVNVLRLIAIPYYARFKKVESLECLVFI